MVCISYISLVRNYLIKTVNLSVILWLILRFRFLIIAMTEHITVLFTIVGMPFPISFSPSSLLVFPYKTLQNHAMFSNSLCDSVVTLLNNSIYRAEDSAHHDCTFSSILFSKFILVFPSNTLQDYQDMLFSGSTIRGMLLPPIRQNIWIQNNFGDLEPQIAYQGSLDVSAWVVIGLWIV